MWDVAQYLISCHLQLKKSLAAAIYGGKELWDRQQMQLHALMPGRGNVQLVNVSTETDAAPEGKSVWVAEMYGHALGAAHLGLRYRGFNDTNHHPPGDPIQRAHPLSFRV